MLINKSEIGQLFSEEKVYSVPHYQRRYVWDETNWLTLWKNILAQLGYILENTNGQQEFKKLDDCEVNSKEHFTGIIVTREIGKEPTKLEVIDGQQRLTTFQIIFCVIRDILRKDKEKAEDSSDDARDSSDNSISNLIKLDFRQGNPQCRLNPTKYDSTAFKAIVDLDYGDLITQISNPNEYSKEYLERVREQVFLNKNDASVSQDILDVYWFFYKSIMQYKSDVSDDSDLSKLFVAIKTKFYFAILTLEDDHISEEIFESLNATGKKLSNFDYLRNHLFLRAGDESKNFYKEYWNFEDSSKTNSSEKHFWTTDKQEAFLRAFLVANLGPYRFKSDNVNPLDMYREYSRTATAITEEFKELKEYAESYQKLKNGIDDFRNPIHRIVQLCNDLNLYCLEPLLLFVIHKGDNEEVDAICQILESYLVRRIFCYGNTPEIKDESYNGIKYFFAKAVGKDTFDVKEFKEFLSGCDNHKPELDGCNGKVCPNDRSIEENIKQISCKDPFLMYYILKRLDHYIREESTSNGWEFSSPNLVQFNAFLNEQQQNTENILVKFKEQWEFPPSESAKHSKT